MFELNLVFDATVGGLLIGFAATFLLLFNGRLAGISGILGSLITSETKEFSWRILFLIGLIGGVFIYREMEGALLDISINSSTSTLLIAGFLTGFGTRLGNGCTSGHGICGIGLLSGRSMVATIIFLFTAIITVLITKSFSSLAL